MAPMPYRTPVFSQDLDGNMLGKCPRKTSPIVLKDVTNTDFPCLCISEETMMETSRQPAEAVWLQLSITQSQMSKDENARFESFSKLDSEKTRSMKGYGDNFLECTSDAQFQVSLNDDEALNTIEVIIPKQAIPAAASENDGSISLSSPSAQQSRAIRGGNNTVPADESHLEKNLGERSPIWDRKSVRPMNTTVQDEDVQAAIKLTVATAETLVIADIVNGCPMCKDVGPTAIFDAALVLRRERDALGLDEFLLEDQPFTSFTDFKWEEDLEDVFDKELYGMPLANSMEEGPCRNNSRLADMRSSESESPVEKKTGGLYGAQLTALRDKGLCRNISMPANMQPNVCSGEIETAVNEFEASTRGANAEHQNAHCEGSSNEGNKLVQGTIIKQLPPSNAKADDNAAELKGTQGQAVLSKDLFNSRWFGGWTGVNCSEGEQTLCEVWQLEKRYNGCLKFETSELSETCNIPSQAQNLLRNSEDFQTKDHNSVVPGADAEALSAGSCAEILLALSQASVKFTSQEPLCSFVPCSVNVKGNPSVTDPAKCNHAESTDNVTINVTSDIANNPVSGTDEKFWIEAHEVLENFPAGHTKRAYLDSLKNYSTISSIHEGTLLPTENQFPKLSQVKGFMQNANEADKSVKGAGSIFPFYDKCGHYELVFKDSALQDSSPLIWHRGKRRRLRACQIIDSDLIQGTFSEDINCTSPAVDANVKLPERENTNNDIHEENRKAPKNGIQFRSCDDQLLTAVDVNVKLPERENTDNDIHEENRKAPKNGIQSRSCDDQLLTSPNKELRVLKEQHHKAYQRRQVRIEALKTITTKQGMYNQMRRRSSNDQIFHGVSFLITGLSASQKNMFEELRKKIQKHGGVIMPSIPSSSSSNEQRMLLRRCTTASNSIVIAPKKVRTLKYLYGCAAGLLIVKPNWLDEMIARTSSILDKKETTKDRIFTGVAAYVHGQRSYCLKLSLLIQHGSGRVVRSMKSLLHVNDMERCLLRVVVVEHHNKLSRIVKETAAKSSLPIVSGDWIIDSLLNDKLLPLPVAATDASQARKMSGSSNAGVVRKTLSERRKIGLKHSSFLAKPISKYPMDPHNEGRMIKPFVSFLDQGGGLNVLSSMGLSFMLDTPKACVMGKSGKRIYYKSMCMDGVIYTAGDIVEVRPEAAEVNGPYIAQIESFYARYLNGTNIDSAKAGSKEEPKKSCFLCCRWFYRPSDTAFPCVGNDKELYLSQHFDENAPVQSIMKKVRMALVIGDITFTNDERGWVNITQTSCTVEAADYVCRYFYDYHKESLHQLKAALTAPDPF